MNVIYKRILSRTAVCLAAIGLYTTDSFSQAPANRYRTYPGHTYNSVPGEAITREQDRLAQDYASFEAMEKFFEGVYKAAGVAENDKKGFYDLIYDKFTYVDKRDFIRRVNDGDITEANASHYWAAKKQEYVNYYSQAYLKGIFSVVPSDVKPHQVKSLNNPPNRLTACPNNIDFEQGSFAGWTGNYASFNCAPSPPGTPNPSTNVGLDIGPNNSLNNQHTLMTSGFDPAVGGTILPCVWPGGGTYSMRLGDVNDGCGEADISFSFAVNTTNTNFTYAFAIVLYDGHPQMDAPKFKIAMYDQNNNPISCGQYSIDAVAASSDPTFFKIVPSCSFGCLYYRPWSTQYVNLNSYVGQTVTVKFQASDCDGGAHRGYAYIDCSCNAVNNIQHDTLCTGHSAVLTAPVGATHYSWNTGPADTLQTLSVTNPGTYTCTLTNAAGCTQTLFTSVTLYPGPVSGFVPHPALCTPTANFSNTTTIAPPGVIGTYSWNFGDGNFYSGANPPMHTYSSSGTYTVSLVVTSTNGCVDSTHAVISPGIGAIAAFTNSTVCQGNPTTFTDQSVGAIGWSWNFGEPSSGANDSALIANPTHTYMAPGTYTVTETERNANCRGTVQHVILVNPLPSTNFTAAPACMGKVLSFNNTSTMITGTITTWAWNFGDPPSGAGNLSSLQSPTHTYLNSGTYNVTLTATSDSGCQKSLTVPVLVTPKPTVYFHVPSVCQGVPVQCVDTSQLVTSYMWNFGEPSSSSNTSTLQNPSHLYSTFGNYTVTLVGASASGCVDSFKINVLVYPSPEATFTPSTTQTTVNATNISFGDHSTGVGPLSYRWFFGTGDTSNVQDPSYTYPSGYPGVYNVEEIVTTTRGCSDTAVAVIHIGGDFDFYAPNAFTPDHNGLNDKFQCYGFGITQFEMMIFDRWGNLLFTSEDINQGWDGTVNGGSTICQQDVYVYKIKLTDMSGFKHSYVGSVNLIK